jgi:hypothetical protein
MVRLVRFAAPLRVMIVTNSVPSFARAAETER